MYFGLGIGVLQVVLLHLGQELVINTFTSEINVIEEMRKCWLIFMVFVIFDTLQGIGASAIAASQ